MVLYKLFILGVIHLVRTQNFPKNYISDPLIRTRTCAYQGIGNGNFSENFVYVLNESPPVKFQSIEKMIKKQELELKEVQVHQVWIPIGGVEF